MGEMWSQILFENLVIAMELAHGGTHRGPWGPLRRPPRSLESFNVGTQDIKKIGKHYKSFKNREAGNKIVFLGKGVGERTRFHIGALRDTL